MNLHFSWFKLPLNVGKKSCLLVESSLAVIMIALGESKDPISMTKNRLICKKHITLSLKTAGIKEQETFSFLIAPRPFCSQCFVQKVSASSPADIPRPRLCAPSLMYLLLHFLSFLLIYSRIIIKKQSPKQHMLWRCHCFGLHDPVLGCRAKSFLLPCSTVIS